MLQDKGHRQVRAATSRFDVEIGFRVLGYRISSGQDCPINRVWSIITRERDQGRILPLGRVSEIDHTIRPVWRLGCLIYTDWDK